MTSMNLCKNNFKKVYLFQLLDDELLILIRNYIYIYIKESTGQTVYQSDAHQIKTTILFNFSKH